MQSHYLSNLTSTIVSTYISSIVLVLNTGTVSTRVGEGSGRNVWLSCRDLGQAFVHPAVLDFHIHIGTGTRVQIDR